MVFVPVEKESSFVPVEKKSTFIPVEKKSSFVSVEPEPVEKDETLEELENKQNLLFTILDNVNRPQYGVANAIYQAYTNDDSKLAKSIWDGLSLNEKRSVGDTLREVIEPESKFGKLASSSANKWLDYDFFTSTEECFKKLKAEKYNIVATALNNESKSIYDFDFCEQQKFALCFGNEQMGLNDFAISNADQVLNIPMHGMIQSLNLSVTAALCLFEMTRQRKEKGFAEFCFSQQKQEDLKQYFLQEKSN